MKEKLIYSNFLNETEFLRSLALLNISSLCTRVHSFTSLTEDANYRLGLLEKRPIFHRNETSLMMANAIDYGKIPFNNFSDINHALETLDTFRKLLINVGEIEEYYIRIKKCSETIDIKSLNNLYFLYLSILEDQGASDNILLARSLIENNKKIYDEIFVINEERKFLTPLENHLLQSLASKVTFIDYLSLFNIKTVSHDFTIDKINAEYGEDSEIESVFEDIYKNNYSFDDCLIVLPTKEKYAQLLDEKCKLHNVAATFEFGKSIVDSNPFRFFNSLLKISNDKFFDIECYKKLLASPSKLLDSNDDKNLISILLGQWKIKFDSNYNEAFKSNYKTINNDYREQFLIGLGSKSIIFSAEEKSLYLIDEFSNGIEYVFNKYAKVENEFDSIVKKFLSDVLHDAELFKKSDIKDSYIELAINKFLNCKSFTPGALHITTIDKCLSTIRKHVYIMGLSAKNFPGQPVENYLANDDFFVVLGKENKSNMDVLNKIGFLTDAISIYKSLGSTVNLSFSCKDLTEVKDVNPSSVIFDYANKIRFDLVELIKQASYHPTSFSPLKNLVSAYNSNLMMKPTVIAESSLSSSKADFLKSLCFSPSQFQLYLSCPFKFYISNILRVKKEEVFDSFKVVRPLDLGHIIHYVLELVSKNRNDYIKDYNLYKKLANDIFDNYLIFNVEIFPHAETKHIFIQCCDNLYREIIINKNYEIVGQEINLCGVEYEGVTFNAFADLLVKDKVDGKYIVYDYKTGSHIKHNKDDFNSCIQGILYAYLLKNKFLYSDIKSIVFYYARFNQKIIYDSPFSENTNNKLIEAINKFKDDLSGHHFEAIYSVISKRGLKQNPECTYCDYVNLCPKRSDK